MCVTGMHRSGTSVAARALELLGVSLGAPEGLLAPGSDNPAGYWENRAIQELDDELLAHLGGSWDQPPVLDPGWELAGDLDPFRTRARAILDRDFGSVDLDGTHVVGFKDPRLSLVLAFWRTVTTIDATILVVRDPREVAGSLLVRNDMGAPEASLLWLRHLIAATASDPDNLLVCHRDLLGDSDTAIERIAAHLGLPEPTDVTRRAVRDHVDPSLDHHRAPPIGSTARSEPRSVAPGCATGDDATWRSSNPLEAMALDVWNDGRPDLGALDPLVADAIGRGWIRSPAGTEALARARAEAVSFKEQLKRRNEVVRALKAGLVPPAPLPSTPVIEAE